MTFIHGIGIIYALRADGAYTGGALIASGVATLSWAWLRQEFTISRSDFNHAVKRLDREDRGPKLDGG